jgi:adhesin transport system outer membrane protein
MHNKRCTKLALFLAGSLTLSSVVMADTLHDAVVCAIRMNPDVRFAATHRLTTDEQLKQQKAGYLPTLDLAAGDGFQNTNSPNSAAIYPGSVARLNRVESALTLDQNLFKGFATKNEVHRLRETVRAAAYKTSGTSEDVALKVVEQYLEILRRQKLVQLAHENYEAHTGTGSMIGERSKAGISPSSDLTQADGRLASAHSSLIAEKGNLEDAKAGYIRVVGIPANNLVAPRIPADSDLPQTEKQAIEEALANHPTLKSANADVAAARAQHETSKSTSYPQIDLVFSATRNDNLDGQPGVNNDEKAMLRGTWNLFKGGQDIARQHETAYQIQEAKDVRNRTIWEIQENTRLSWDAWKTSKDRLKYLKEHRDLSRQTIAAYQDQFKLNQRTLLDVLDSQNEYYQSSVDYVTAEYTLMYAKYRLLNSLGRLMDYVGVALPAEAKV